tara:strand:+ start:116 stop:580 length:465 start_codon:yes stop_codon:yes gene_type:complete
MINDLKDDLGIKEFNRMSCDTHVKRDSSEIGLSIPETFNDNYFLFKKSLKQPLWCKSLKSHSTTGSFKKGSDDKQTVLEDKMKQLILKGLGKAKVRKAIKLYLIDELNNHLDYNHSESFIFYLGQTIEGYGLPEMDEDDPFHVEDLINFLDNKI